MTRMPFSESAPCNVTEQQENRLVRSLPWTALAAGRGHVNWIHLVVIITVTILLGIGHFALPATAYMWHNVLQRLFYLPVLAAAVFYGWRGGLLALVFALVFYSPWILTHWETIPNYSSSQYEEVLIFCLAAIMTGILADKGRKQRLSLEQKTMELSRVYQQLQDNFEQMKRSERLYAIGRMSAGLAHEIRNPLASIEGAAAILRRDSASEKRSDEFLAIIQKECRRLDRLLTDFLRFASPRLPEHRIVVVERILNGSADLATHAIGDKAVVLRKVIINLLINAIQATPDGGDVVLSAQQQNNEILLAVRDNGCGVFPEDLEKMFDPFFTTKENGTGLGLSVAHQIVSQHRGILIAENNEGKGMTFTIRLPLRQGRVQ
jgi:two-component system sensor histidine kinase HydH